MNDKPPKNLNDAPVAPRLDDENVHPAECAEVDEVAENLDSDNQSSNSDSGDKEPKDLLSSLDAEAGSFRAALVLSANKFESEFREKYPLGYLAGLWGPLVVTLAVLLAIGLISGWGEMMSYVVTALVAFFVLGRFVIPGTPMLKSTIEEMPWIGDLGFAENLVVTSSQAFFMLTYMDVLVALFVTFNMGFMFRLPWVGAKIGMMVYDAKFILDRYPWIKKVSFFGLVLFVIFPASTTGSIGGSIFGRMLGLGRLITLLAIVIGSVCGNLIMFQFAELFKSVQDNMYVRIAAIVLIIVLIVGIEMRYRNLKKRFLESKGSDAA